MAFAIEFQQSSFDKDTIALIFFLCKYVSRTASLSSLSSENLVNHINLIKKHLVISLLYLDSALQTLLTSSDKEACLNAKPDSPRGKEIVKQPIGMTAVNSMGDDLESQLTMASPL